MDFKIAIFDFDGTLADTREMIVRAKQEAMRRMGLEVASEDECAATIGLSSYLGFKNIFPDESDEVIEGCISAYRAVFDDYKVTYPPSLFPGVLELLEKLKSRGVILAVASSRNLPALNDLLERLKIIDYFEEVYGAESTERLKPDPEPVNKLLERFGTAPGDALVVGDMPFDISMGKGAGAKTCGVTFGNSDREELLSFGADIVIDRYDELIDML